jgi:hypothetical protein
MGAENVEPERRRDVNTRKVIEVLTEHIDAKLDEKMKGHVTWQGLAGSVVALVGLIFIVVSAFMTPVKESAAQTRAEVRDVKGDTAAAIREMRQDIRQISAEVRAVKSVTVDGQPRGRAQEELRRTNAEEK